MQVTMKRKVVQEVLSLGKFAEKQAVQPLLGYARMSCTSDQLVCLEVTNLQISLRATFPAKVRQSGVILIPLKAFMDMVKVFPLDDMNLDSTVTGSVLLYGGKTRFTLMTLDATDFPQSLTCTAADERGYLAPIDLRRLLDLTNFSACHDISRPHLNGIFWEVQPQHIRMVSTDGHRLSIATMGSQEDLQQFTVILPLQVLGELRKLTDLSVNPLRIELGQSLLCITATLSDDLQVVLSLRPVEGQFPPYEKIKPQHVLHKMVLNRVEFLDILRRVAVMQQNKALGTRFAASGMSLNITAESEVGNYEDSLPLAQEMQIDQTILNVKYLIDILTALNDEQVIFELGGPLDMGVLRNESGTFYGVIMPMNQ